MEFSTQRTQEALNTLSFSELKPIQTAMLDQFKTDDQLVLIAPTGSGKTLAFLLPILETLTNSEVTQAVIIAPARELALQIEQVFKQMKTGFKINCCYGGHPIRVEKNNLLNSPQVIVGTPGRIADHLRRGTIDVRTIKTLVLDEFDKAIELGFEKDISAIIDELYSVEKRVLVSATQQEDSELPAFTKMPEPKILKFIGEKRNEGTLSQFYIRAEDNDKLEILKDLVYRVGNEPTIIFCNHREAVERIGELLKINKIPVGIFHGTLKQEHRERELTKLRNGSTNILIATDLAARGIDIPAIKNVIHYQIPLKEDAFIHRNGRTARMDSDGNSFIMLKSDDYIPEFISQDLPSFDLSKIKTVNLQTKYATVYVGLGRKDKINKVDIVGLFYKKGGLVKDELGKIEVLDYCAFVAVDYAKARQLVQDLKSEKIKKKTLKISIAR
jgi:superfamily II DNA/RNA helicase|tara:strand:- start:2794 stop:4122 length:1329 start_codon:yes stop_codon:yes gene_type:complete